MRRSVVVAGVLLLAALLTLAAEAAETVRIGDLPAISTVGFYVALDKGFFQETNVAVEMEPFASGGKMIAPLATGQIDVATGTPSAGLYNAIASGMEFRVVADKGQQRPGFSFTPLVVRKDLVDSGRVKRVRDLKGMKVSVGAKGINLDYFLARMLEHDGLAYEAVETTVLAYPDSIKALATKAIDAAIVPEPWGVRAEEQKVGTRLFLTEQTPSIATFQTAVVMYSAKFIKERPGAAKDVMRAYVKGVRYYRERGLRDAEIAAIISRHTKVPAETVRATIPMYIDPGARPRVQDLNAYQAWFHQMGWVKTLVPVDRIADLSFLE